MQAFFLKRSETENTRASSLGAHSVFCSTFAMAGGSSLTVLIAPGLKRVFVIRFGRMPDWNNRRGKDKISMMPQDNPY